MIAKELYRLRQKVEAIEAQMETVPLKKKDAFKALLRKQRAELNRLQRMLDGAKELPSCRPPR